MNTSCFWVFDLLCVLRYLNSIAQVLSGPRYSSCSRIIRTVKAWVQIIALCYYDLCRSVELLTDVPDIADLTNGVVGKQQVRVRQDRLTLVLL